MYSFEYNGTTSKGINFLRGLPIVADTKNTNPEIVAHGDELGYMFDCNDVFGNPIPEARLTSEQDLKVRSNLIGMIVKFAKEFKEDTKIGQFSDNIFKSVTGKGTPFIKVDTDISADSDFRFCELSLFGASLSPVTSTSCEGLGSILSTLQGSLGGVSKVLDGGNIGGNLGGVLTGGNRLNTGGFLGGTPQAGSNAGSNRKPGGLNLFGLL